ncbi:hypothetical protein DMA11_11850 [Marinilabiliaceae bacterium JC017]|nr:hypothetical protein DMA11_11850 [Marinilabiliaceae bacterium JC017]
MRTLAIIIVAIMCQMEAVTASNFNQVMKENIVQMYKTQSVDELNKLGALFYRIGETEQGQWLPYYYAAYAYASTTFFTHDSDSVDSFLDKAQSIMDNNLKQTREAEVHILQALIYSMRITSPARGYKYSTLSDKALGAAEKLDPNNPRLHYWRGNNVMHTPKMFGGGKEKALKHFLKAQKLFASYHNNNEIWPAWGEEYNNYLVEKCNDAAD